MEKITKKVQSYVRKQTRKEARHRKARTPYSRQEARDKIFMSYWFCGRGDAMASTFFRPCQYVHSIYAVRACLYFDNILRFRDHENSTCLYRNERGHSAQNSTLYMALHVQYTYIETTAGTRASPGLLYFHRNDSRAEKGDILLTSEQDTHKSGSPVA